MTRLAVALVVAAMAAALVLAVPPIEAAEWPLQIVTVARPAEARPRGAPQWTAASLKGEIGPGDGVRTLAAGRLTLRSASGQALRLAPLSRLQMGEDAAPQRPLRAVLESGWLWVAVLPGTPAQESFEIEAGPSTVTVRDGGVAIMRNRDGSVMVRVYHGAAACTGTGATGRWEQALAAGQELFVAATGAAEKVRVITGAKPEADWVKVNEEQDLAGGYGARPPAK